jgi:hypothetical protein
VNLKGSRTLKTGAAGVVQTGGEIVPTENQVREIAKNILIHPEGRGSVRGHAVSEVPK